MTPLKQNAQDSVPHSKPHSLQQRVKLVKKDFATHQLGKGAGLPLTWTTDKYNKVAFFQ
jgi:hypothetical protein